MTWWREQENDLFALTHFGIWECGYYLPDTPEDNDNLDCMVEQMYAETKGLA